MNAIPVYFVQRKNKNQQYIGHNFEQESYLYEYFNFTTKKPI